MTAARSASRRVMSEGKHRKRLKLSLGDRNNAIVDLTLSDEDGRSEASGAPESKKSQRVPAGESAPIVLPDSDEDSEDAIAFVSHKERPKPKSINEILKDSSGTASGSTPPRPVAALPPLLLTRPEQVAQHTPCSIHFGILPAALAERLYRVMLAESKAWERNRWYLADRHVESPHTTAFYSTDPEADSAHWYMGRKDHKEIPNGFLPEMEEARQIIEAFVNNQLEKRPRYGLEYHGPWRANVAAANCYKGRAEVGLSGGFLCTVTRAYARTSPYRTLRAVHIPDRRRTCGPAHLPRAVSHHRIAITRSDAQFPLAKRPIGPGKHRFQRSTYPDLRRCAPTQLALYHGCGDARAIQALDTACAKH